MGGFLSLFHHSHQSQTARYEKDLEKLQKSIENVELRQKRRGFHRDRQAWNLLYFSGALEAFWIAFVFALPTPQKTSTRAIYYGPIVLVPLIYYLLRRLLYWYHDARTRRDVNILQHLKEKKQLKLEELKNKTRFNEMCDLIKRLSATSPELRTTLAESFNIQLPTPQPDQAAPAGPQKGGGVGMTSLVSGLVDRVLGDEASTALEQRYALICSACHTHNGLVLPQEILFVEYTCPKCNHFNPARQAGSSSHLQPPNPLIEPSDPLPAPSTSVSAPMQPASQPPVPDMPEVEHLSSAATATS